MPHLTPKPLLSSSTNKRIPISISNGQGFIWNINDLAQLRVDHHICGLLTGTLPQLAQQNVFLGLPLQLLPEEVVLLVELGIAVLVDERTSHRRPTIDEAESYQRQRAKEILHERQEILRLDAIRRTEMEARYSADIARAAAARKARDEVKPSIPEPEQGVFLTEPDPEPESKAKSKQGEEDKLEKVAYYVPVPLRSQSPCYQPTLGSYTDLESARQAGVWTYPNTAHQRARCEVFKALWKQGMYMGIGFKFGCDFLVYPGDTLRFHSHFACTVVASPSMEINPIDLVSFGRLATAVKKAHLLACWDSETNSIEFLSLEWAGMG
ncbi:hypothetical protein CROQUDRAFT_670589 [Cronartium quercuum f. sp. fusiforme G11]|uniref:tRNA-splicing endonuclease subunit Sen34 n=1 Tax=Cronartium quercuum f. sp. fusiforme G11 TaxID=708437 RepID=A0A9P6NHY0_9BASI|nr:hypothetical protein CROQUDRAFT_670589 [Cronartium quercuum f. sp. fusiforme G11]